MRSNLRWLMGLGLGCLLVLACQAQGPTDPDFGLERYTPSLGDEVEVPTKPEPGKKYSDCVLKCEEERDAGFRRCVESGIDPVDCARKFNGGFRLCVERCQKQCQAECADFREDAFQRCIDAGGAVDECARRANVAGESCRIRCQGGIKEDS